MVSSTPRPHFTARERAVTHFTGDYALIVICTVRWSDDVLNKDRNTLPYKIQGDRRESDGFKKKKYSADFQLEMDVFLQN